MNTSQSSVRNMTTRVLVLLTIVSVGIVGCSEEQIPKDKLLEQYR